VLGQVRVYRIADLRGRYAVLSVTTSSHDVPLKYITLKYLQPGHELIGEVRLEAMCELHKLQKDRLSEPFGEPEQVKSMTQQSRLHAWLRKMAMAAGMKDKKPVAQRKAA
jgi:hypothetical protein